MAHLDRLDHILFLLSLLLPAVLVLDGDAGRRSRGFPGFLGCLQDRHLVYRAHSITLSLAALGVISLPSRLVESAIATSVVLAALNNVFPVVHGRRWMVAFAFGLIHGFVSPAFSETSDCRRARCSSRSSASISAWR